MTLVLNTNFKRPIQNKMVAKKRLDIFKEEFEIIFQTYKFSKR